MPALAHARDGNTTPDAEKTLHRVLKLFPEAVGQNKEGLRLIAQNLPCFVKICHDAYPAFSLRMRRTSSRSSGA